MLARADLPGAFPALSRTSPQVDFEKPNMPLDILMKYGKYLVEEQDNVKRVQLADAYLAGALLRAW
jgi:hypothetical protein